MPDLPAITRDVVVVGSAESIPVLQQTLRGLPADFPAAVPTRESGRDE